MIATYCFHLDASNTCQFLASRLLPFFLFLHFPFADVKVMRHFLLYKTTCSYFYHLKGEMIL